MRTLSFTKTLLLLIAASGLSLASPIPDFPFITTEGHVHREVSPTEATVSFTIMAVSEDSEKTTAVVQSALSNVIIAIKEAGATDAMIEAHDLKKSVIRQRDEASGSDTKIIGYQISREAKIKLPDLGNYAKIVRTLMTAENITEVNSDFDTNKRDEIEAELVGEACAVARKKADLLAKGAGVKIAGVHAMSEQALYGLGRSFGLSNEGDVMVGGSLSDSAAPLFVPSRITLFANVNILYKIAP